MTDRIKGFTVTLERDFREDEIEDIIKAIQMIKGVQEVNPIGVSLDDAINRNRIRTEYKEKFINFIYKELK